MPVWLRRFYIKQLQKSVELEKEEIEKAQNKSKPGISRGPRMKT